MTSSRRTGPSGVQDLRGSVRTGKDTVKLIWPRWITITSMYIWTSLFVLTEGPCFVACVGRECFASAPGRLQIRTLKPPIRGNSEFPRSYVSETSSTILGVSKIMDPRDL
ncbi:uncharacterized protein LOC112905174 [Agrilus planipennis]|uniref:Uncharacterized protein LOC112905174 n=1 Tax=Agrilus planipennis TaxID=224129 RepID=A0A7F5RA66_AGRPL|nr:uncharacterized protein LOC112905174 [Agrilus planipennis]